MVLNQQRRVRVSVAALDKFLAAAQKRLRLAPDSLTVALVRDPQMARWNAAYRGKNRPTDVLSFPADGPVPQIKSRSIRGRNSQYSANVAKRKPSAASSRANGPSSTSFTSSNSSTSSYLGDIAIAPNVARRNAAHYGRTVDQEIRILILHGVLHLMGYDHETDQGQMTRRENRLRRDLGLA